MGSALLAQSLEPRVYFEEGDFIAMKKLTIFITLACVVMISPMVLAQNWQPAAKRIVEPDGEVRYVAFWVEKWWGLDLVTETGGFGTSAGKDYLLEGSQYANIELELGTPIISNASVSTRDGAGKTASAVVYLEENGGPLTWGIVDLDVKDQYNMSTSHGFGDAGNITWHGIIAIISPDDRTTTMHPAHDDHAQIWLNSEMVYDNSRWTGGAQSVLAPTEIQLKKGENYLHFKCGESGGADYVNLRFEPTDIDLLIAPTLDNIFLEVLTPVEPKGKLATQWGALKRK